LREAAHEASRRASDPGPSRHVGCCTRRGPPALVGVRLAFRYIVAVRRTALIVGDAVRDLYSARWGEPSRRARFEVGEFNIEVFKWSAGANPEGVALYATLGASERPMVGRDPNHRVEFFLGLVPERDEVADALAALGLYAAREGTALDHGHTVPAAGPLWPGTQMRTFIVLRPLSNFLPALELPVGVHVDFLQAVPLFDAERAWKSEHGTEALLQRWERDGVPFWSADRAPGVR